MAAICQFHQHGHCKFADKCVKIHTSATCDSFPCQDIECPKRHPRMCKYYAMYGRCVYAERCSFLHFRFSGGEQTASQEVHAIEQEVYELREEVKHLRVEVKHMLSLIKDLKEEIDVDRVRKQGNDNGVTPAQATRPELNMQQIVHLCGELAAKDEKTLVGAMEGITDILTKVDESEFDKLATMVEQCGGLDMVARLQHRQNIHISEKAARIMGIFCTYEDQTDEEITPKTDKPDKFTENRDTRNKEGKRGTERNLGTRKKTTGHYNGPGRGQNVKQRN
jgi:hypothetical protein